MKESTKLVALAVGVSVFCYMAGIPLHKHPYWLGVVSLILVILLKVRKHAQ